MRKYLAAVGGTLALTSLFGYLLMAYAINAVGEAVDGMGDIEADFDDYDLDWSNLGGESWQCPDVVCIDGIDGWTPDMLRHRDVPQGTIYGLNLDNLVVVDEYWEWDHDKVRRYFTDPMHD